MKINDIIIQAVREMFIELETQKDFPYEKCPFCGSDDFDIKETYSKKCYSCGRVISFIELKNLYEKKAEILFETKVLSLCGQASRRIKSEL